MKTLIDNDCALKTCRFDLVDELVEVCDGYGNMHVLDDARFVFNVQRLDRARAKTGSDEATLRLKAFLERCQTVSVRSDAPILSALSSYANIDAGEALIFAAGLEEAESIIFTGDKRAIQALAGFLKEHGLEDQFSGRLKCYEQIVAEIIDSTSFSRVAAKVRGDLAADSTMRACFSCAAERDVIIGLSSYYRHLDAAAPGLLAAAPPLLISGVF